MESRLVFLLLTKWYITKYTPSNEVGVKSPCVQAAETSIF